jgi:hypothetical protein
MQMNEMPRYSIAKYILLLVLSSTISLAICSLLLALLGRIVGFGCQGVIVILLFLFPVLIFSVLYGFYKGLVRYYGLSGRQKIFLGGKL